MHIQKYTVVIFSLALFGGILLSMTDFSSESSETRADLSGCILPPRYMTKIVDASAPYQPWQVRVSEDRITWNGAFVTSDELTRFAQQLSKLPKEAGSAVFQVTNDVSCSRRTSVRKALALSDLCSQNRCWESNSIVKAPVVY